MAAKLTKDDTMVWKARLSSNRSIAAELNERYSEREREEEREKKREEIHLLMELLEK